MPGAPKCTDPDARVGQWHRKAKPRHRTVNCRSASLRGRGCSLCRSDRGVCCFGRLPCVELPAALFNAASPLVPGNDDTDMVRASALASGGDFLLRLAGCQGKHLIAEGRQGAAPGSWLCPASALPSRSVSTSRRRGRSDSSAFCRRADRSRSHRRSGHRHRAARRAPRLDSRGPRCRAGRGSRAKPDDFRDDIDAGEPRPHRRVNFGVANDVAGSSAAPDDPPKGLPDLARMADELNFVAEKLRAVSRCPLF